MAEWSKAHVWNTCDPQGSQSSNLCLTDFINAFLSIYTHLMNKPQQYEAIIQSHSYSPNQQVDFLKIKILDADFRFQEGQFIMIRVEIN